MTEVVLHGELSIAKCLYDLVAHRITPGTGIEPKQFWDALAAIVRDLGSKNRQLLDHRDTLQNQIEEGGGEKVVAYAMQFLDQAAPLRSGSYANITALTLNDSDHCNHKHSDKQSMSIIA